MFYSPRPEGGRAGEQRLRINPVNHAREGNNLAHVLSSANPSHDALESHAETRMRHAAIAAEVQIPLEGFLRQFLFSQSLNEEFIAGDALASADDLAVALRSQHVESKRQVGPRAIGLHVEGFDRSGIAMNHHRPIELLRKRSFLVT